MKRDKAGLNIKTREPLGERNIVSDVAHIVLGNYRKHKDKFLFPDDRDLLRFIDDTLPIMHRLQARSGHEQGEFWYAEGHLHYSRGFHGKWTELTGEDRRRSAEEALRLYEKAVGIMKALDPSELTEEQSEGLSAFIALLELNVMETKWQMAKRGYIPRQECLDLLAKEDILKRLRAACLVRKTEGFGRSHTTA
jgi:hypothetical protein